MLKSHKAIVGSLYYKVSYFILPAVFAVVGILFRAILHLVPITLFLVIQTLLMMFEMSTEYFGYGPIYRKNNLGMEYLKTSVSGMQLFRQSILTDQLLRIARCLFYTLIPGLLVYDSTDSPLLLLLFGLALANTSIWSVTITRYITMYGFLMITNAPLLAIGIFICSICYALPVLLIPACIVLLLLLPAGVVFTVKFADNKIRASYSDLR